MTDAPNSAYSPNLCTKTPRTPELPPDAKQMYSSSRRLGVAVEAARWASTAVRLSRRSVTTSSNAAIISGLRITGRRGRSPSSNVRGSMPRNRCAWNGDRSIAVDRSSRNRSR